MIKNAHVIVASKKYGALSRPHRCRSKTKRVDRSRSDDRCRSGASQLLKRTAAAKKKNEQTTKNTQMVVNVKEFANAGSVKRRAPAHCGKSFHVTVVAQIFDKKKRLREKNRTKKKTKQKNN